MTAFRDRPIYVSDATSRSPALHSQYSQYPTGPESVLVLSSFLNWADTAMHGCPAEGVSLVADRPTTALLHLLHQGPARDYSLFQHSQFQQLPTFRSLHYVASRP